MLLSQHADGGNVKELPGFFVPLTMEFSKYHKECDKNEMDWARVARPCSWTPKLMVAGWGSLERGRGEIGRDRTCFSIQIKNGGSPTKSDIVYF